MTSTSTSDSFLVADTSGLVSLSLVSEPDLLDLLLTKYNVTVPQEVLDELDEMAEYCDSHAKAARRVLESRDRIDTVEVETDPDRSLPLDKGENAGIQLAEEIDADLFYCDEYNNIGLIHATLSNSQLVTTPRVLKAFVLNGDLTEREAKKSLDKMSEKRSWESNSYVQHSRNWFESRN